MKLTEKAATQLQQLPIAGKNVLVDAAFEQRKDAEMFNNLVRAAVGSTGTIVMPAFTNTWTLLDEAPSPVPYHQDLPLSSPVGMVAEAFRKQPGALRSGHPSHSFTALGHRAHDVLSTNRDNNPLGPVKKLNVMNGASLLAGLPLSRCTAIHLAEALALPEIRFRSTAKRINLAGYEERVVVERLPSCTIGYDRLESVVGDATLTSVVIERQSIRLFELRPLVRACIAAIALEPRLLLCGKTECPTCVVRQEVLSGAVGSA